MLVSHPRFAAMITVGLFIVAACSSAAPPIPVVTPTPPASSVTSAPAATAAPTPVVTSTPTSTASLTASPATSADATPRVVDLTAILDVAQAERFETFGDEAIRLEQVWSPNDAGLGGTCGATNVPWLECGLADWLILPVADGAGCPFTWSAACYGGPALEIFYDPGLAERLALGDGPVDLIGHFGDPASESCRPANRAACRDRFVVAMIEHPGN
jgi:hypothetical protein